MARTRSGGPRTRAGKTRSSLNAIRHGLAARQHRQTAPPDAVDCLAQAMCGGKDDAELLAAARATAETAFVLQAIRQQKLIVIERLKDATAIALRKVPRALPNCRSFAWLELRAGHELPQSLNGSPKLPQNGDRVHRLPEWLPHNKPTEKESAEDRCSTAAA